MKRKTLKIIGLSLLAGVIVGMGLLARPLVDRLVESVAATDKKGTHDRARTRRRLYQPWDSPHAGMHIAAVLHSPQTDTFPYTTRGEDRRASCVRVPARLARIGVG